MGCANSSTTADVHEEAIDKGLSGKRSLKGSKTNLVPAKPFEEGSLSDYKFVGKLGQGAYATVHRAHCSTLGDRIVAVKVLSLRSKDDEEWGSEHLCQRGFRVMQEEVAIMTRVTGKANVIDFYGSFREGCLSFFVMEQCDRSLLQGISRLPAITESTMCRMLKEMLSGLVSLHEAGIVHRDVKPDNFLCVGPQDTVKLCDFGLSSALPRNGNGLSGIFGTPPFMCPEMLLGSFHDHTCDSWAFGVIIYSLFYGRFPYEPSKKSAKAMKEAIRSGIPLPSFRLPAGIQSGGEVSVGAKQLAIDLLNRDPERRISAKCALSESFFAKPGSTNLAPMLESAKSFGAFCATSRNNPSHKNAVDLRIESLQLENKGARTVQAFGKLHVPAAREDEECSTHVASDYAPGVDSPVSTLQSLESCASMPDV